MDCLVAVPASYPSRQVAAGSCRGADAHNSGSALSARRCWLDWLEDAAVKNGEL